MILVVPLLNHFHNLPHSALSVLVRQSCNSWFLSLTLRINSLFGMQQQQQLSVVTNASSLQTPPLRNAQIMSQSLGTLHTSACASPPVSSSSRRRGWRHSSESQSPAIYRSPSTGSLRPRPVTAATAVMVSVPPFPTNWQHRCRSRWDFSCL